MGLGGGMGWGGGGGGRLIRYLKHSQMTLAAIQVKVEVLFENH